MLNGVWDILDLYKYFACFRMPWHHQPNSFYTCPCGLESIKNMKFCGKISIWLPDMLMQKEYTQGYFIQFVYFKCTLDLNSPFCPLFKEKQQLCNEVFLFRYSCLDFFLDCEVPLNHLLRNISRMAILTDLKHQLWHFSDFNAD